MLLPGIYGLHLYVLMFLAHRRRRSVRSRQHEIVERFQRQTPEDQWPRVTTQLPLYNEIAVAQRVIEAAARMDYPADRHEIQVLDDSTDETRQIVDQTCARLRDEGLNVVIVRRPNRDNYKAGALEYGLARASGEYIAVFDADFVPNPGFLRRMIPLIATQQDAGCAQGRWGHLNADESWITESLSLGIDGHFGVEQGARSWNGLLLNFNGTGGIWRRAAIDDPRVGGWQGDTLTEDLDLSYRAQLAGWKVVYCLDEICPAEIPANVDGLKTQQRRWATGSIQTARKLLPSVWRSRLTLIQKLEATFHLTQYSVNLFMLLMALLGRPLLWLVPADRYQHWLMWSWWLILIAAAAPSLAYVYARWSLGGGLTGPVRIFKLIVLGLGLSLNNACAVLAGLVQRGGEFVRTPKTGSHGRTRARPSYGHLHSRLWIYELLLGAFCLFQWLYFLKPDYYVGGTFLLLFAIGLFKLGWASRPRPKPQTAAIQPTGSSLQFSGPDEQRAAPALRVNG